jgi:hypothetical protein
MSESVRGALEKEPTLEMEPMQDVTQVLMMQP